MSNCYDWSADEGTEGNEVAGFWGRLHPSIRAALILWAFLIVIALVNSFSGGTSVVLCYPVQLLLYVGNGALAAHFALGSGYPIDDLPKVGALAGLGAWVLPALFYLVVVVILGIATLGIGFLGVAGWLLCGPIDLAIEATCGALGAWVYGSHFGGSTVDESF